MNRTTHLTPERLRTAADTLDPEGMTFMCFAVELTIGADARREFEDVLMEHGVTLHRGLAMVPFDPPRGRDKHEFRMEVRFMFLEFLALSLES